jgi:hypothetical protein
MSTNDKQKEATSPNTAIIIAVIGVIGTIIVALITSLSDVIIPLIIRTPTAEVSGSPGIISTAEVSVLPTFTPSPQALIVNGARYTFPDLNTAPHCIAPEVATGEARAKYNLQVPKGWVMVWDSNKAFWADGQYENNGLLVIYGEWTGSIEIEKGGSCSVPVEWLDFALKQRRESFPVESRPEFYVGEQP